MERTSVARLILSWVISAWAGSKSKPKAPQPTAIPAAVDAWKKVLDFYGRHLKGK